MAGSSLPQPQSSRKDRHHEKPGMQDSMSCTYSFTDSWNRHFDPHISLSEWQKHAWSTPRITHVTAVFCEHWMEGLPNATTEAVNDTEDRGLRKLPPALRTFRHSGHRTTNERSTIAISDDVEHDGEPASVIEPMASPCKKCESCNQDMPYWKAMLTSSMTASSPKVYESYSEGTTSPCPCCLPDRTALMSFNMSHNPDTESSQNLTSKVEATHTQTNHGHSTSGIVVIEHQMIGGFDGLGLDYWARLLETSGQFSGVSSFASSDVSDDCLETVWEKDMELDDVECW